MYLITDNIVICLNENNNIELLKEKLEEKLCYNIYCGNDWKFHKKKFIAENNTCVDNCSNFKYENDDKCYEACPKGVDFCQIETEKIETTILTEELNLTSAQQNEKIYQKIIN